MANKLHIYEFNESNLKCEVIQYWFHCPGCMCDHAFTVGPQRTGWGTARWSFNGDLEKPTFHPSLLCNNGEPSQCHSFVEDGNIRFLGDCWHGLKGQTVPLPDWESW